jgi:hypothetical protein
MSNAAPDNVSLSSLEFPAMLLRAEVPIVQGVWNTFAQVMTEANTVLRFRDDSWEQDWFLAKYAKEIPGIGLYSQYAPPSDVWSFPMFDVDVGVEQLRDHAGVVVLRSPADTRLNWIFKPKPFTPLKLVDAVEEFYQLRKRINKHGDAAMKELNIALAWLKLALGNLFTGLALTPSQSNLEQLMEVFAQRWSLVWNEKDVYEDTMSMPELIQWKLDVFYGAEIRQIGLAMQPSRQGQPIQWQQHWQWLSDDMAPELALRAVRLAARLMISVPCWLFIQQQFRQITTSITPDHLLACIVFRRCVLQLAVMSWLETALSRSSWQDIRPQDLMTFAFTALRPYWPRRVYAISHRSQDIKSALSTMRAWNNFRFSIDANFMPHWETNVATVWGLFSAVPALIRVPSQHYENSVWCRREREILEYLRVDDFLPERYLIEVQEAQLPILDDALPSDTADATNLFTRSRFPHPTPVFRLFPYEPWECRLLACAAAVRFTFLKLRDRDLTEKTCRLLAGGVLLPSGVLPPLTNHPAGWRPIAELFTALHRDWSDEDGRFPIRMPAGEYTAEDFEKEIQLADTIMDLSDGLIDEPSVLAAYEWNRTIVPALIGNNKYGSSFSIDFRHASPEHWATDESGMVIRGIGRVRTSVPLWFLQSAEQRVDEWIGIGKSPVLTLHVPNQWDWMMDLLDEVGWPAEPCPRTGAHRGIRFTRLKHGCPFVWRKGFRHGLHGIFERHNAWQRVV